MREDSDNYAEPAAAEKLTARDVRDALRGRWPDSEYLTIEEAPDGPSRTGRKLDAVVVSLWRSRGYELDGIEIKVSHSDWMRELNNAAKADFWWRHVHRFWVAVPLAIAPKVRETLPSTWGLLAVQGGKCREVVKAPKHDAEPLTWEKCVGLMRAACDAGPGALMRAEQRGYDAGYKRAEADIERTSGDGRLRTALDALQAKVAAFQEASGIDIAGAWSAHNATQLGKLTAFAQKYLRDPEMEAQGLRLTARRFSDEAKTIEALVAEFESVLASHSLQDPTP